MIHGLPMVYSPLTTHTIPMGDHTVDHPTTTTTDKTIDTSLTALVRIPRKDGDSMGVIMEMGDIRLGNMVMIIGVLTEGVKKEILDH